MGLDSVLATGEYTLFAPSNDAVSAFTGSITSDVLTYHVVEGTYLSTDVPTSDTVLTTVNGDTITVMRDSATGVVTVTDAAGRMASVTSANIAGTNGVVHIIDDVLEFRDVVGLASDRSDLTTLVSALGTASLVSTLQGPGPFTVLAPTDEAFAAITIPSEVSDLTNVLTYHVIGSTVLSTDLTSGLVATTLQTETVTAQIDAGVFFYDSNGRMGQVTVADIVGTNGVIHVIDAVLLPGGTVDDITGNIADLSSLDGALEANSLDSVLADTTASYTLFAPSNTAVADFTGSITSDVLTYHVIGEKYFAADMPTNDTELTTVNGEILTVVRDAEGGVTVTDFDGRMGMVTMANIAGVNGVVHVIDIVLSPDDLTTSSPTMEPTPSPTFDDSKAHAINALFAAASVAIFAVLF